MTEQPATLEQHLALARRIHEKLVAASGLDGVEGSCFYAAFLLARQLEHFQPGSCPVIRGGGDGDGGYQDQDGVWRGHYWVEALDAAGIPHVLDLTADQFGGEPLVCAPLGSPAAGRYRPGDQTLVDAHVAQEGPVPA